MVILDFVCFWKMISSTFSNDLVANVLCIYENSFSRDPYSLRLVIH